ncbi:MAG: PAS domain S-box protein, partial [Candidatus Eisenbacteria bacterium]
MDGGVSLESVDFFRCAYEDSASGMALATPDGRIVSANPAACRILGYEAGELVGLTFQEITHPDDVARCTEQFRLLIAGECARYEIEKRYIRKDGRVVHGFLTVSLLRDGEGNPLVALAQMQDMTDRLAAEEGLRRGEARLRGIFETSADAIILLDLSGRVIEANHETGRMLGLESLQEFLASGPSAFDLIVPEERERGRAEFERVLGEGTVRDVRLRVARRDGSTFEAEMSGAVQRDETGNPAGVILVVRDVTERTRAEEALAASEEKYRTIFENAAEGILIAQDGMLRMVNPAMVRMTGRTEEELLSRPFVEFIHPDDREVVLRNHKARLDGLEVPPVYEVRLLTPEGSVRWIDVRGVLISWQEKPAGLNFLSDVTDRRRAEEGLRANLRFLEQLLDT